MFRFPLFIVGLFAFVSCSSDSVDSDLNFKAILSIDNQLQAANESEHDRGTGFYFEIKSMAFEYERNNVNHHKSLILISTADSIENYSSQIIELIEKIKTELLSKEDENIHEIIQFEKDQDPSMPSKTNLELVENKFSRDAVSELLVSQKLENTTVWGSKLWDGIQNYRKLLIKAVGTNQIRDEKFSVNPMPINEFKNQDDLRLQIEKIFDKSAHISIDDRETLIYIYQSLTMNKYSMVNGEKTHWINSTFQDLPLFLAISRLTALENLILKTRTSAFLQIMSRSTDCDYSFNKIITFVSGPTCASEGEEIELKISIGAFDSDVQPVVTINNSNSKIEYEEGVGIIKLKPKKGIQVYEGEIGRTNKSGAVKKFKWKHVINVL